MNILALCTSNSARSILLEGILNSLGTGRVTAFSAGSHPGGTVHPQALRLLAEHGHDTARARSKSWDIFAEPGAPRMDLVITVCDAAAAETCPFWPGAPLRGHWGVPDPAALPPEAQEAGFNAAYALLRRRAEALLALSPDAITASELARIGALE
jgi:protein-tyrosine-phosphatase